MIGAGIYLDTSVLLKWYLPEPFSAEAEFFILDHPGANISSLSVTEFRCSLARRQRSRMLSARHETKVVATFAAQIAAGYLTQLSMRDEYFGHATELIDTLRTPLRTLDALHLAVAHASGCKEFATADKQQANAARALGLTVHTFY